MKFSEQFLEELERNCEENMKLFERNFGEIGGKIWCNFKEKLGTSPEEILERGVSKLNPALIDILSRFRYLRLLYFPDIINYFYTIIFLNIMYSLNFSQSSVICFKFQSNILRFFQISSEFYQLFFKFWSYYL